MNQIAVSDHPLDAADFKRLAEYIHRTTGIKMPPSKKHFLEGRLRKRVIALKFQNFSQYCAFLFDQGGLRQEEIPLIDAVTTNKTDFLREPHHFDFLAQKVWPEYVQQNRSHILKFWSAGCSTGAEPYSIAICSEEFIRDYPGFSYQIWATDICVSALDEAAKAIYPHPVIDPLPLDQRRKYLLRDKKTDEVKIAPKLRKQVKFNRLNLIERQYQPPHMMDVIFCRNLLIYFDKPTQKAVVQKLCQWLRPGGYLFVGHSESLNNIDLPLQPVGNTIYQLGTRR